MQAAIADSRSGDQFATYDANRTYATGEIARGSDGTFYEFYDRDQVGTVQGVDPTDPLNRPHIWMEWDGVKPGATIEWRSETLPEGYVENDGAEISRADYRRVFAVHGTTYGAGDGSTTFLLPDDRGEFKRGWDHGRGVDSGRVLATPQGHRIETSAAAITPVQATIPFIDHRRIEITPSVDANYTFIADGSSANYEAVSRPISRGSEVVPAGDGSETRPRNNAAIYLTKI